MSEQDARMVEKVARSIALTSIAGHWYSAEEWDSIIPDRYKQSYYDAARAVLSTLAHEGD